MYVMMWMLCGWNGVVGLVVGLAVVGGGGVVELAGRNGNGSWVGCSGLRCCWGRG